jgi:hypothetical protein
MEPLKQTIEELKYPPITIPDKPDRKIDPQKALDLRFKGLTYKEIATFFNCSKQAVWEILQPLNPPKINLSVYEKNRTSYWKGKEFQLISSLTKGKIKKMNGRDLMVSAGIAHDKVQLQTGQSTANIQININDFSDRNSGIEDDQEPDK